MYMRSALFPMVLVCLLVGHPHHAAAQSIEDEIDRAGQRLEAGRAAHLDLIAPRSFERAAERLSQAEVRFTQGGKIDEIRKRLTDAAMDLERCERLQEIGNLTLRDALQARDDALASNAPQFSPELWKQGEKVIQDAGRSIEDGNQNSARREAAKAVELYRNAELQAIRADVLGRAKDLRQRAVQLKAEERASTTLAHADQLLVDAEKVLEGDRYQRAEARKLATAAAEEYSHAARLAQDAILLDQDRKRAPEMKMLEYEAQFALIAEALRFEPHFADGTGPVSEQIVTAVGSLSEDRDQLGARVETLRAQIDSLESRLSTLAQRDVQLQLREARERRLREVQSMFSPDEAEVLMQGNKMIVRLYGLSFPSGSSEIRPQNFPLLTKVQRILREFAKSPVTIEGHTDSIGDDDYNHALSQRRAGAVREYLLANMTLGEDSIDAVGFGERRPIANNETADGRAKNRRIDVVVALPAI